MPFRPIGSLWGKWDLHFHTPSSYDYKNKAVTNQQIVEGLLRADVVAVAITDHHLIDSNRVQHLQSLGSGKLTVFPGIELRSELGGRESVHLIGIFSENADPEHIWTKLQGRLNLTVTEVQQKGDDRVYVHFEEAADLIHELNGVVSVHVGRKANSIERIGNDHPYKRAFKEDLARKHVDLFEIGRPTDISDYQTIVLPAIGRELPQLLLKLVDEKNRELDAHEAARPAEITKPAADPAKQKELEEIGNQIEAKQAQRGSLASGIKQQEALIKAAALRQAVAERILGRLRNFEAQYEKFVVEATADAIELNLSPRALAKVEIDRGTPTDILNDAKAEIETARQTRARLEDEDKGLREQVDRLSQQLDAPNLHYQNYLQQLDAWNQQRSRIIGDENQTGSINYIRRQIQDLDGIPARLSARKNERERMARDIYAELQNLVSTYKSLYSPVQRFIEEHSLAAGKFNFEFEASVAYAGLEEELFLLINQGRRGSFCGAEEGRRVLKNLAAHTDFNDENETAKFCADLMDHFTHDKREAAAPEIPISEQLKKGATELDLTDCIFSLKYLRPKYSLKWSGKNIEELSPGERGTLLLIFYLLIDRRETPLIIDQPEENLDNHTVYDLLVPCIKEARNKRQVVIVTHNPNLAVVCDADQVIHCSIDKQAGNRVAYETGSLENPAINKYTINVLEGTRPAFDLRDSKYQGGK